MKLLITLTLALADANGRLTRYARNSSYSTSHPGRCDRNVFERQFYDLAKGLEPTSDKVTAHSYENINYEDTEGRGVMADKIKDWIEQLLTIPRAFKHTSGFKHKIPDDVSFVYCQLEACVIGKRNRHVEGSRPGLPGHDFPGRR